MLTEAKKNIKFLLVSLKYNWKNSHETEVIPAKREPANKITVGLVLGTAPGKYIIDIKD